MHQSRRLTGSYTLRRLRYHQHRLRFKLEYCGHKRSGGDSDMHDWGGTNRVRFRNVSTQQGSLIPARPLTIGYVSSHFSIQHKGTWMFGQERQISRESAPSCYKINSSKTQESKEWSVKHMFLFNFKTLFNKRRKRKVKFYLKYFAVFSLYVSYVCFKSSPCVHPFSPAKLQHVRSRSPPVGKSEYCLHYSYQQYMYMCNYYIAQTTESQEL